MIPRIIYAAILLSGFASLGYELCWIRKGALLIGATPQALSSVVAVFFGGMAVGAYLFGLLSKRIHNPLLWYGIIECTVAVMAAITPMLFRIAGEASALAYQWAGTSQILHLLVRSALVAALIFPSCVLIGGTLPLLCQFFINNRRADVRFAAGKLYAINTAGAFLGCMLCGIWFIPAWGIDVAIWCNALLSFIAGAAVILLSKTVPSSLGGNAPPVQEFGAASVSKAGPDSARFVMYVLFFWAGFTALGYEILWMRFLSLIINNTVYTCIFSLGAILLGIAIGGWLVCLINSPPRLDAQLFAAANIFICFAVLFILLQPVSAWESIRESRSVSMQALLCLVIILIPSIASGASFPLAYRMVAAKAINSGRDFGFLTSVNTLGGIAGSLLVGFYFLPGIGMFLTLAILTLISLTIGIVTIFMFTEEIQPLRKGLIACGAMVLWLGITTSGGASLPRDFLAGNHTMIEFAEGISSFIAVTKRGEDTTLEIDRMWQGINNKGHQIMAAHIPMMLHQDPKRVLVIGIGTGQTASRFLMYDIDRLDCVDIEKTLPGILQRNFDAAWLDDPRTQIVTDDGRNFTSHTSSMYDIVSVEVGQSFRPQIASFYTVDFYRDVKKRLTENGLACQFVPVGFFTGQEFRSIVKSFLEVFPQSTLWFNKYAECILVGSTSEQPRLSRKRLALLHHDEILRADLEYAHNDMPYLMMNKKDVFAANFLMGPQTLLKLSANAPIYTDDQPILEYQAARNTYDRARFHTLIEKNMDSPDAIFAQKIRVATELEIIRVREGIVHETLAK
ncbi:MAG: fused MFS/spermidine synthase [Desulfuromonadaceae bacterium]|nr:fused MFS/spermidine synthase [Desulfuromonadaceae bacterium]MDD5107214.1 fused MFS/spermidine synthase [Desulfuromonadaceae bacterium]